MDKTTNSVVWHMYLYRLDLCRNRTTINRSKMRLKTEYEKLMDDFPAIFRQKSLDMSETCMCWGCDCGPGWEAILRSLCETLANLTYNYGIQVEFEQVKEKFGELRVYHTGHMADGWQELGFKERLVFNTARIVHTLEDSLAHRGWRHPAQVLRRLQNRQRAPKGSYIKPGSKYPNLVTPAMIQRAWEKAEGAIDMACSMSAHTCEQCGATKDVTQTSGWVVTLCPGCHEKRKKADE
jgi:hypothetical protein